MPIAGGPSAQHVDDSEPADRGGRTVAPHPSAEPGMRGPAFWIAVGVVLGASASGILLSYFRQSSIPTLAATEPSDAHNRASPPRAAAAPPPAAEPSIGRRVNLNTASQAELELLPGVGPTVAKRILDYRVHRGRFSTVEELDRIKGIGPRMLERLRPVVEVE